MIPHFEILTLFPEMFEPLKASVLGKAQERGLFSVGIADIRDHAFGKHRSCDDTPYGGGAGMVMRAEPLVHSIEAARARRPGLPVVLLSPRGQPFSQPQAWRAAQGPGLILVCGRYEGVDERVMGWIDQELSLGDFVLSGGEFAALVVVDAVARLIPGVLGNEASAGGESFEAGVLEFPQYTRPPEFRGLSVPEVLLSGHHAEVARWRRRESLRITRAHRPDMFQSLQLSAADRRLLEEIETEK